MDLQVIHNVEAKPDGGEGTDKYKEKTVRVIFHQTVQAGIQKDDNSDQGER